MIVAQKNALIKWRSVLASAALTPLAALVGHTADNPDAQLLDAYQNFNQGMGGKPQGFAVLSQLFSSLDHNGDGSTPSELDQAETIANAAMRASAALRNLMHDLDGDMIVTQKEIETGFESRANARFGDIRLQKAQLAVRQRNTIQKIMSADVNKNGTLEGTELLTTPAMDGRAGIGLMQNKQYGLARALLAADPNSDNLLTEAEAFGLISSVSIHFNSIVDSRLTPPPQSDGQCQPVKVNQDSDLILVGAYEGSQVSTIAMAGQDKDTSAAAIMIERGEKPLTIVLSSYDAMVWKFSGNVARVAKVVAVSNQENPKDGKGAVGIVGIPGEKVEFFTSANCLQGAYEQGSGARAQLSALTGRAPGKFVGEYEIGVLSLPSGQNVKQETSENLVLDAVDNWAKRQMNNRLAEFGKSKTSIDSAQLNWMAKNVIRFNTGGIADFVLKDVVSAAKAEDYEVLPQQTGLLQLVKATALTIEETDSSGETFKVEAPMRYPAGLAGSHSVTFIVNEGVAPPAGDPGHSTVKSESCKDAADENKAACGK